jgi:hypothetical protein
MANMLYVLFVLGFSSRTIVHLLIQLENLPSSLLVNETTSFYTIIVTGFVYIVHKNVTVFEKYENLLVLRV